jgi:hypothetical protein
VLPPSLPEAWQSETTTALAIAASLSKKSGQIIPWRRVRDAIDGASRARYLETTLDSGAWPCEYPGAQAVKLRVPSKDTTATPVFPTPMPTQPHKPGIRIAEADLRPNEIQDLADAMGELTAAAVGYDLKFHLRIELGGNSQPTDKTVERINKILKEVFEDLKFM